MKKEVNDTIAKRQAEYYQKNKEKITKRRIEYYKNNKEKIAKYYQDNKAVLSKRVVEYHKKNKKKVANKKAEYRRDRIKNDPLFYFQKKLKDRILIAIKRQYSEKAYSSIELLGCTIKEVREHLEKQFKPGMTWNNHSQFGWHIDHIRPCASFDLTDPKQQKECFNYTNLQPLWWIDNIKKGSKIEPL